MSYSPPYEGGVRGGGVGRVIMTQVFNKKSYIGLRKRLRGNSTVTERKLWMYLRSKQLNGYKFRRQYGIQSFIVDFYCPAAHLVIELDGSSHGFEEAMKRDMQRQKDIEALGIQVLRFTDQEVLNNLEGVLEEIMLYLPIPPPPTPTRG